MEAIIMFDDFPCCLSSAEFYFQDDLFRKLLYAILSDWQTVWTQIRDDFLSIFKFKPMFKQHVNLLICTCIWFICQWVKTTIRKGIYAKIVNYIIFPPFFLYILPDPFSSIFGRCTLYTPGFGNVMNSTHDRFAYRAKHWRFPARNRAARFSILLVFYDKKIVTFVISKSWQWCFWNWPVYTVYGGSYKSVHVYTYYWMK